MQDADGHGAPEDNRPRVRSYDTNGSDENRMLRESRASRTSFEYSDPNVMSLSTHRIGDAMCYHGQLIARESFEVRNAMVKGLRRAVGPHYDDEKVYYVRVVEKKKKKPLIFCLSRKKIMPVSCPFFFVIIYYCFELNVRI